MATNGFYRSFAGNETQPQLETKLKYQANDAAKKSLTGNVVIELQNKDSKSLKVEINDLSYKTGKKVLDLPKGGTANLVLNLQNSHQWYDFSVKVEGNDTFEKRYAGHVETGRESFPTLRWEMLFERIQGRHRSKRCRP